MDPPRTPDPGTDPGGILQLAPETDLLQRLGTFWVGKDKQAKQTGAALAAPGKLSPLSAQPRKSSLLPVSSAKTKQPPEHALLRAHQV